MKTEQIFLSGGLGSDPDLQMYYSSPEQRKRSYVEHHHTRLEISAVVSGSCQWQLKDKSFDCVQGNIILFGSDEAHYITSVGEREPFQLLNLQFEPRFIWSPGSNIFDSRYLGIFLNHDASFNNCLSGANPTAIRVFRLMEDMHREGSKRESGFELIAKAELMLILGLLGREYHDRFLLTPPTMHRLKQLDDAVNYINTNLSSELSLDGIAKAAGMGRTYFSTVFKQMNGITVWQYITGKRIELAMRYLAGSDMKIVDVSTSCGYNNLANFNRCFYQICHMTPRDYRKLSAQNP